METKTIVSVIVQLIVAINETLMAFGITAFSGFTEEMIYAVVSTVAMVIAWGYGVWKNHNFTQAACEAQGILDQLKGKSDNNELVESLKEVTGMEEPDEEEAETEEEGGEANNEQDI